MNTNEFDDIIRKKAQQREAEVTADIWEGIREHRKRRRFPFFWLIFLMLILSGTAVVWNFNNENKAVKYATRETAARAVETAGPADAERKATSGPNNFNDRSPHDKLRQDDAGRLTNSIQRKQHNPGNKTALTKTASAEKNHIAGFKKQPKSSWDGTGRDIVYPKQLTSDDQQNQRKAGENSFLPVKRTRNTKGRAQIKVSGGGIEEFTDDTKSPESFSAADKAGQNKHRIIVAGAEKDQASIVQLSASIIPAINEENKQADIASTPDSVLHEKNINAIADSSLKKDIITTVKKKSNLQNKKSGFKIEGGFTIVSPVQQYKQPLYVKRVFDRSTIHSEFTSDDVKTNVESGAGININLLKTINNRWSLGTGVQYLRFTELVQLTGIEVNRNYTITTRIVTDPTGSFIKTDTITNITKDKTTLNGRNIYQHISLPLFARFVVCENRKWNAELTGGLFVQLLSGYNNSTPGTFETFYDSSSSRRNSNNNIGFDLFAGLHLTRKLSNKYELFAEPAFRYNLTRYKSDNLSFNKRIHKPGISFGISKKF